MRTLARALPIILGLAIALAALGGGAGCGFSATLLPILLDDDETPPQNQPTTVIVTSISRAQDPSGALLTKIDFIAFDPESDPASLDVFYRIPGTDFSQASLVSGTADVSGRFPTSPSGTSNFVFWDQRVDLGPLPVSDVELLVGDATTPKFTSGNAPPTATAEIAASGPGAPFGGLVPFTLTLVDGDADLLALRYRFSTDGGGSFHPMTIAVGVTGDAPSAPEGVTHTVVWSAVTDMLLAPEAGVPRDADGVIITILPSDPFTSGIAATLTGISIRTDARPSLAVSGPAGGQVVGLGASALGDGRVRVDLLVADADSAAVSLEARFRIAGGAAQTLTAASLDGAGGPFAGRVPTVSASPTGAAHALLWDVGADLGRVDRRDVTIEITPFDASGAGVTGTSLAFTLDGNRAPVIATLDAPLVDAPSGRTRLGYAMRDLDAGDAVAHVEARFYVRRGATLLGPFPATGAAGDPAHEGTGPLAVSTVAAAHVFVWEASADLPRLPTLTAREEVLLELVPLDASAASVDPLLGAGPAARTAPFRVDVGPAPRATVPAAFARSPLGFTNQSFPNEMFGDVEISFTLEDDATPPASTLTAHLEHSDDGGATWRPLRVTAVNGATLPTPLLSTVQGLARATTHRVRWPTVTDGLGVPRQTNVLVRIAAEAGKRGAPATATAITIDNGSFAAALASVDPVLGDRARLEFTIAKQNATSRIDAALTYSRDGVTFLPATEAPTSLGAGQTSNLAAGPHVFLWSAFFDLAVAPTAGARSLFHPQVTVRVQAQKRGTGEQAPASQAVVSVFLDGIETALGAIDAPAGTVAAPTTLADETAGAALVDPASMAIFPSGDLLVVDRGQHAVRLVNRGALSTSLLGVSVGAGRITSVLGALSGGTSLGDGGPARLAGLDFPSDVALDLPGAGDDGRLYVADTSSDRVRRVDVASTRIETLLGADDPQSPRAVFAPAGVAVTRTASGTRVYVVERGPGGRLLAVDDPGGAITLMAGGGADADGVSTSLAGARFEEVGGLAIDAQGRLLVSEQSAAFGGRVKRVDAVAGTVERVAGRGPTSGGSVSEGARLDVALAETGKVAVAPAGLSVVTGGVIVVPCADGRVLALHLGAVTASAWGVDVPPGEARTIAGNGGVDVDPTSRAGDGGPALVGALGRNRAVALGPLGELLVCAAGQERVRRIAPSTSAAGATLSTVAGRYGRRAAPSGIAGNAVPLFAPGPFATTPADGDVNASRVLVPDPVRGDDVVYALSLSDGLARPVTSVAVALTLTAASDADWPGRIASVTLAPTRSAFVTTNLSGAPPVPDAVPDRIFRWSRNFRDPVRLAGGGLLAAAEGQLATGSALLEPRRVALRSAPGFAHDELFFAETGANRVWRVRPEDGRLSLVLGRADGAPGSGLGHVNQTELRKPLGLAFDASGRLLVCDSGNHRVLRIEATPPGNPDVTALAGDGTAGFAGDLGPATLARLDTPSDIAVDPDGSLWVADAGNHRVRRFVPGGTITTEAGGGVRAGGFFGDGGAPDRAALLGPAALGLDAAGHLRVLDAGNRRVRRVGVER